MFFLIDALLLGPQTIPYKLGIINISKFGPRDYEPTYNDDDTGFRLATTVKQGE